MFQLSNLNYLLQQMQLIAITNYHYNITGTILFTLTAYTHYTSL